MPASVHFDVGAFCAGLVAIKDRIEHEGFTAWNQCLNEAAEATNEHGYQNRTGKLTADRLTTATHISGAFSWRGQIKWMARYGYWVDKGRGPVRPIRAKRLRWFGPGGRPIFSMYSKPSKPAHFSDMAAMHFLFDAPSKIQAAIDSAIRST